MVSKKFFCNSINPAHKYGKWRSKFCSFFSFSSTYRALFCLSLLPSVYTAASKSRAPLIMFHMTSERYHTNIYTQGFVPKMAPVSLVFLLSGGLGSYVQCRRAEEEEEEEQETRRQQQQQQQQQQKKRVTCIQYLAFMGFFGFFPSLHGRLTFTKSTKPVDQSINQSKYPNVTAPFSFPLLSIKTYLTLLILYVCLGSSKGRRKNLTCINQLSAFENESRKMKIKCVEKFVLPFFLGPESVNKHRE